MTTKNIFTFLSYFAIAVFTAIVTVFVMTFLMALPIGITLLIISGTLAYCAKEYLETQDMIDTAAKITQLRMKLQTEDHEFRMQLMKKDFEAKKAARAEQDHDHAEDC